MPQFKLGVATGSVFGVSVHVNVNEPVFFTVSQTMAFNSDVDRHPSVCSAFVGPTRDLVFF